MHPFDIASRLDFRHVRHEFAQKVKHRMCDERQLFLCMDDNYFAVNTLLAESYRPVTPSQGQAA